MVLSWRQVRDAAIRGPIVHKPPGRGKTTSIDWEAGVQLREAEPPDAEAIANWISDTVMVWLGGDPSKDRATEVHAWLEEAHVALVLLLDDTPIAFVNIARLKEDETLGELGRLIVHPDWRHQGVGSTLLHHLGVSIVNTSNRKKAQSPRLFSRVNPKNEAGIGLIRYLPFSPEKDKAWLPESEKYNWYRYLLKPHARAFGPKLQKIRESKRFTQAELAFLCGVRRPTINMIESGRRLPSLELLQRLQEVLATSEYERAELLFAAVSEDTPQHLSEHERLLPGKPELRTSDLWIFTDRLAEFQDERFLEDSVEAIKNGRQRWYFLPKGQAEDEGDLLAFVLKTKVGTLNLENKFRIYTAPAALCQLRLSVHNPNDPSAFAVQVEGAAGQRMNLSTSTVERLVRTIRSEISKAETGPAEQRETLFSRFSTNEQGEANEQTNRRVTA